MKVLDLLKNIVNTQESQSLYKYIAAYIIGLSLLLAGLIFWHYRSISRVNQSLKKVSKERIETGQILSDYQIFKQQENKLEDIFDQTKGFRIIEAYNNIISTLNLAEFVTSNPEPIEDKVKNYIERKISINLTNISTEKLVQLLEEIQKYERLYAKELSITNKAPKVNAIDVSLVIATLEPILTSS